MYGDGHGMSLSVGPPTNTSINRNTIEVRDQERSDGVVEFLLERFQVSVMGRLTSTTGIMRTTWVLAIATPLSVIEAITLLIATVEEFETPRDKTSDDDMAIGLLCDSDLVVLARVA